MLISSLFEFYYRKYIFTVSRFGLYFDFLLHSHSEVFLFISKLIRLEPTNKLQYQPTSNIPPSTTTEYLSHLGIESAVLVSDYQVIYLKVNLTKSQLDDANKMVFVQTGSDTNYVCVLTIIRSLKTFCEFRLLYFPAATRNAYVGRA